MIIRRVYDADTDLLLATERVKELIDWGLEDAVKIKEEHLEAMAVAYLAKTSIDPRDVVLVEDIRDRRIYYYYAPRDEVPNLIPGRDSTVTEVVNQS